MELFRVSSYAQKWERENLIRQKNDSRQRDLDMFLGATKHLYNWLCPSVGRLVCLSVGNAFVRRSTRRTLLVYLALFFKNLDSFFLL